MIKLKELTNEVSINGVLIEKELEETTITVGGKEREVIKGYVTVEVTNGQRINNIRSEVFSFRYNNNGDENGIYKGFVRVKEETKDRATYGADADFVNIQGSLSSNDYVPKDQQEVRSSTRISARFISRVDESKRDDIAYREQAKAMVDVFIFKTTPFETSDGEEGIKIKAMTVGYGNRVIELKDVVAFGGAADIVEQYYTQGSHGLLTFNINNYAETVTKIEEDDDYFGESVPALTSVRNFVRNFELVGLKKTPIDDEQDIDYAKEVFNKRKEDLKELITKATLSSAPKEVEKDDDYVDFSDSPSSKKVRSAGEVMEKQKAVESEDPFSDEDF